MAAQANGQAPSKDPPPDAESKTVSLQERHPPLGWLLDRFHMSLDTIREMTHDIIPTVLEREKKRMGPSVIAKLQSLEPAQRERLERFLEELTDPDQDQPDEQVLKEQYAPLFDEVFRNDRHSLYAFIERLRKAAAGPDQAAIVYNSVLTQAIGSFEVLVSGIITRYFLSNPAALEASNEKEFSLADLRTFKDVDDAADTLIARQVSKVMYGGLEDWAAWFAKRCKFDWQALSLDWMRLSEVMQRRHAIMHNGGLVSRQYLAKVPFVDDSPSVGDRLSVDATYLDSALDELDVLGTLLGVMAWGSWHKDQRNRSAGVLLNRSYELMLESRWSAVERLTSVGMGLQCSAAVKEPILVNHWNCRLELRGLEDIREEVTAWDVSISIDRFRLAKLVLLGEFDEAAELVPELLARKELQPGELREWPILRSLREYEGFDASAAIALGTQGVEPPADAELHGPLDPSQSAEQTAAIVLSRRWRRRHQKLGVDPPQEDRGGGVHAPTNP